MVRVAEDAARRDEGRRHRAGEVEAEWVLLGRQSRRHAGEPLVEAGGVRQQVMQRDWSVPRRQLEPCQVSVHVAVEIEAALFHQLHHGGRGYHLRHRRDAEHGALRINRAPGLELCRAVATRAHQFPVCHHRNTSPGIADAPSRRAKGVGKPHHGSGIHSRRWFRCVRDQNCGDAGRRGQVPGTSSEQEDVGTAPEFDDVDRLRNCRAGRETPVARSCGSFANRGPGRRQPAASRPRVEGRPQSRRVRLGRRFPYPTVVSGRAAWRRVRVRALR